MTTDDPNDLAYTDTLELFRVFATHPETRSVVDELVLIGGQAVNFWAEVYRSRLPGVEQQAPFTSKDVDVCGPKRAITLLARYIGGAVRVAMDEHNALTLGTIVFIDRRGTERVIDFIDRPAGLEPGEAQRLAIAFEILDREGLPTGVFMHVLHPISNLVSRVHNVVALDHYRTPHGVKQASVAIECARAFLLSELEENSTNGARNVLNMFEKIAEFCIYNDAARRIFGLYGLDPFSAVFCDERLPVKFNSFRYPQMRDRVMQRRK